MAWTEIATGDAQAVKRWSDAAFYESINKTYFANLVGESEDSIIQMVRDVNRERGDNVKIDLLNRLDAPGVFGDDVLEDQAEGLSWHQDNVGIDQLRNAFEVRTMSQQRTVHDLRMQGMRMLSQWFAERYDLMMHAHLAGFAGAGNNNATRAAYYDGFGGNSYTAVDAGHTHEPSAAITLDDIDFAVELAQTVEPMVRPAMIDGQEYYVLLLHPYSWTELRKASVGAGGWVDVQKQANVRGDANPILSGASGIYNNVVIWVSNWIPYDTGNTQAYNLLLGAQAGVIAFGNPYDRLDQETFGRESIGSPGFFNWIEQRKDFGNRRMVGGAVIAGIKGTIFNSAAFGRILVKTDDAAHT